MIDPTLAALLERLASPDPGPAWLEFIEQYSPLLMHVVRRHETDRGRAEDCYSYVCAALSDDGFRRLRKFELDGAAQFRTWLMAVAANLCTDWQRREHGRVRPFRVVARLSELEQSIYHYLYVRGMQRRECAQVLEARYPGLTEQRVAEINARLFALLTPQQRWQLGARATAMGPPVEADPTDEVHAEPEDPGPGPEQLTATEEERRRLHAALTKLTPEQRLLLRLRFEQNLTLAEVARLTGLADPFRARRQVDAALAALAELMGGRRKTS